MKKIIIFILAAAAVAGCVSQKKTTKLVGGDREEHGCLTSAGYTWSVVKNDCVRLWEAGIKMQSVANPDDTQAAYVIFSTDSARVEVFIPSKSSVVLKRNNNMHIWGDTADQGGIAVTKGIEGFMISSMNNTLYKEVK